MRAPYVDVFKNKDVSFQYRKRTYVFSLSHGLFSSADIDTGSKFLLKVFSDFLDSRGGETDGGGNFSVLDAGSGVGVLGICAAGALADARAALARPGTGGVFVRAQDRDELARLFTEYNARKNGIPPEELSAHTEPLLAGPGGWDLILSNIPAKAGLPVLEDFIRRSASLLKKDGRVFLVAVNTLADFFRSRIEAASLLKEVNGKEHTVFVFGAPPAAGQNGPLAFDEKFPQSCPFYIRAQNEYKMENISYHLDTVHGAPDFDSPGGAVQAAAKLAVKIDPAKKLAELTVTAAMSGKAALLMHDAGQGHFALWLANYLKAASSGKFRWVLSSRNILALGAARAALSASGIVPSIIPVTDIFTDCERLAAADSSGRAFALIAYFPETTPDAGAAWEGINSLAMPGALAIAGMSSSDAERFDRKKPPGFVRLDGVKRKGFRAIAYLKR